MTQPFPIPVESDDMEDVDESRKPCYGQEAVPEIYEVHELQLESLSESTDVSTGVKIPIDVSSDVQIPIDVPTDIKTPTDVSTDVKTPTDVSADVKIPIDVPTDVKILASKEPEITYDVEVKSSMQTINEAYTLHTTDMQTSTPSVKTTSSKRKSKLNYSQQLSTASSLSEMYCQVVDGLVSSTETLSLSNYDNTSINHSTYDNISLDRVDYDNESVDGKDVRHSFSGGFNNNGFADETSNEQFNSTKLEIQEPNGIVPNRSDEYHHRSSIDNTFQSRLMRNRNLPIILFCLFLLTFIVAFAALIYVILIHEGVVKVKT